MRPVFRQADDENTAVSGCALYLYFTMMQFDNALRERQADAGTGLCRIRCLVTCLVKAVEYLVNIFFVDTDAVIYYFNDDRVLILFDHHLDTRSRFGVFECV